MKSFEEYITEGAPSNKTSTTIVVPSVPSLNQWGPMKGGGTNTSKTAQTKGEAGTKGTGLGFDNVSPELAKEVKKNAKTGESVWHTLNRMVAIEKYRETKELSIAMGLDIEYEPKTIDPLDSYREAIMKFSEYQQETLEMLDKQRQTILSRIWEPTEMKPEAISKFEKGLATVVSIMGWNIDKMLTQDRTKTIKAPVKPPMDPMNKSANPLDEPPKKLPGKFATSPAHWTEWGQNMESWPPEEFDHLPYHEAPPGTYEWSFDEGWGTYYFNNGNWFWYDQAGNMHSHPAEQDGGGWMRPAPHGPVGYPISPWWEQLYQKWDDAVRFNRDQQDLG